MRKAVGLVGLLSTAMLVTPTGVAAPRIHDFISFTPRTARYIAFENASTASLQVQRCCHVSNDVSAEVVTEGGTAVPGSDYTETQRTLQFTDPIQTNDISVPLINDAVEEPIETFQAHLQNPTGGATLGAPRDGTVFVVDDDGAPRISFILSGDLVFENRLSLDILIVRSGDPSIPASVTWSTQDGTATAGTDYEPAGGAIDFAATERRKTITVETIDDRAGEGNETFSIVLSDPTGATLVDPAVLEITIADNETPSSDTESPVTAFHQPLHGRTYRAGALTDVLVLAEDTGVGVDEVHIALRKKMRSGACRWYMHRSGTFERAPCNERRWISRPGAETVIYTLKGRLAPSTPGHRVRFYKAWSRGRDELNNTETAFDAGRNVSRFEIRA